MEREVVILHREKLGDLQQHSVMNKIKGGALYCVK